VEKEFQDGMMFVDEHRENGNQAGECSVGRERVLYQYPAVRNIKHDGVVKRSK